MVQNQSVNQPYLPTRATNRSSNCSPNVFFSEHGVAYVCQIRFSFYRVHNQTCSFGELPRLHKPTFGHIPPYPISFVFYYVMIGIHTHNFVGQINESRKPHVCSMVASICTKFQICAQYPSFCVHYSTKNT